MKDTDKTILAPYIDSFKQYQVLSKEEEQKFFQCIDVKENKFILCLASDRLVFQKAILKAAESLKGEDEECDKLVDELATVKDNKKLPKLFLKTCRSNAKIRSLQEAIYKYLIKHNRDDELLDDAERIRRKKLVNSLKQRRRDLQKIRNEFAKHNLKLVISLAKRYSNNFGSLKINDLVQEGNIGLMKAIEKFDTTREVKFSTYSSWWVKQSIRKSLHDKARTIRIPVHLSDNAYKIRVITNAYTAQHNRAPTEDELAKLSGFSKKLVRFIKENEDLFGSDTSSLDKTFGEDESLSLLDMLSNNDESVEETLYRQELSADLTRAISSLTTREAFIIRNRLFGGDLTLQEIGDKYDISRERIRQLEAIALGKLRKHPQLKRYARKMESVQ